ADSRGWTVAELAIKFILSQNKVTTVLPTVVDSEEIEIFAQMSDGKYLQRDELESISELYENNFFPRTMG
ncbi:MAG TPA: aldo/keto reductase, partial [Nitrososphaeraceae archaeon]|nr:aldo/keto reductase [Nitrososphaeraceae archaeon]